MLVFNDQEIRQMSWLALMIRTYYKSMRACEIFQSEINNGNDYSVTLLVKNQSKNKTLWKMSCRMFNNSNLLTLFKKLIFQRLPTTFLPLRSLSLSLSLSHTHTHTYTLYVSSTTRYNNELSILFLNGNRKLLKGTSLGLKQENIN